MKILFIHNKYQIKGGEDSVLKNEIQLLKKNGHHVDSYIVSNNSIKSMYDKIKVFFNIHYSSTQKVKISKYLKESKPDIVHVHNFFPLITPSVFDACIENNIPVIHTLHNFRLICPSGLLMHKNKIYEKSIKNSAFSTVFDKVYRNSYIGTFSVARMIEYHKKNKTWQSKVDQFIALTNFSKSKFLESGFLDEKISIKPNFSSYKGYENRDIQREGALFVGRLSEEKGIKVLLKAWENLSIKLKIIGDGPLSSLVMNNNNPNIEYLGFMNQEKIFNEMQKASFLVFPSQWYEGFPMVIIESFANGLPIIASNLGSMAEIIKNDFNGLHFKKGDVNDLIKKIYLLNSDKQKCKQMSLNAISEFQSYYTEEKNYELLIKIYKKVIDDKKSKNY